MVKMKCLPCPITVAIDTVVNSITYAVNASITYTLTRHSTNISSMFVVRTIVIVVVILVVVVILIVVVVVILIVIILIVVVMLVIATTLLLRRRPLACLKV